MSDTTTTTPAPATDGAPAQPTTPQPTPTTAPTAEPGKRDAADTPLGEAGLKALREERAERERLEREMKPLKEQMEKLQGIFGQKAEPGTDVVASLQEQMAAMQKDNLVNRVARRHGIADDGDIEFLRTATDEQTMTRLAERLRQQTPPAPTAPAPDPSQASAPMTEEAAANAAYEAFFPTRT